MMIKDRDEIKKQAKRIILKLKKNNLNVDTAIVPGFSQMGSGSLPEQNLATSLVAVTPKTMSDQMLADKLRNYDVPIFSRLQNGQILFDPRTLRDGDEKIIVQALIKILDGDS